MSCEGGTQEEDIHTYYASMYAYFHNPQKELLDKYFSFNTYVYVGGFSAFRVVWERKEGNNLITKSGWLKSNFQQ